MEDLEKGAAGLWHGLDRPDFRDVVLEVAFDPQLEGHGAGGAADARAVEADLDNTVGGDANEFDISAVGLDGRSDAVEDQGDAAGEFGGWARGRGHSVEV